MKKETLKDLYFLGDLVEDESGRLGIVIAVTRNKIVVKLEYGTSTYTDIQDLFGFRHEVKGLMNIGELLKKVK